MEKNNFSKVKILNKIKQYEKTGELCATEFLDPIDIIENTSIYEKYEHLLYGGFKDAERKVIIFGSTDPESFKEFVKIIEIKANKKLNHRSVLGSVLGLGIRREVIGDIILEDEKADIFVLNDISKYILNNLEKVGNERVKVYEIQEKDMLEVRDNSESFNTTVASLRVDATISACFGVSREVATELVKNEKVKLNYKQISNNSKQINEGDLISVRGFGRIIVERIIGETRKNRVRIEVRKYKG